MQVNNEWRVLCHASNSSLLLQIQCKFLDKRQPCWFILTVVHVYMLFYHLSAHRYMKTMFLQFSDYISIDKINCCQWIISELAVVKQLGYMYSATFISTLMTVLFSLRNSKKNFFDHTLTP